jgi:hypothetical protein
MEFLWVKFDGENCGVIVDGASATWRTNEIMQLDAGHHRVSLALQASTFSPATQSRDTVSRFRHTPHIIPSVAMATATISMDNYSFDTVDFTDRLMKELREAESVKAASGGAVPFRAPVPYVIEIGFEAIPDKQVKDAFLGISISFHLPDEQVRALISMGCGLLKNDPFFRCMLEDLERKASGQNEDRSACVETPRTGRYFKPLAAEQIVCPKPGDWPGVK